ncbi:MAG: SDR family NAD(P)-dependent oxidoreductase [Bacteroidota bacterium]
MRKLDFKDKWILITGASSGLGKEIARQLALQHQANLIIVARRKTKLEALKKELESSAKVEVVVKTADLSIAEEVDKVVAFCLNERPLYGAVLNAGTTYFGKHQELEWSSFQTLMQTNIMGLMRMLNPIVQHFEQGTQEGGLLIISSMAAFSPVPYQAAYSATKAYLSNFSKALSHEIQNPNFSISVFEPGGIVTEMTDNHKFNDLRSWLMTVEKAASEAIYTLQQRKYRHIPGLQNQIGALLMRFLPGKFIASRMAKIYHRALSKTASK